MSETKFQMSLVNANWFIFGGVMLTVGMFLIYGSIGWFIASIPLIWLFGAVSAVVIGGHFYRKGRLTVADDYENEEIK